MYAREINGQEFTFGVSGKLIRNVLVMYDRQTGSFWSQLLGEAVDGDLVGTKLEFVPSWMMTWAEWQALHPESLALDKNGRRSSRDTYTSYYSSPTAGVIGETIQDDRLYTKEFVVGVELGEEAIAYPFSALNVQPIVNDLVADTPLLIVFDVDSAATAVFSRDLDGNRLTFSSAGENSLTDAETGSTWDLLTGEATAGELAGAQLTQLKSTTSFWFGWEGFSSRYAYLRTIVMRLRGCGVARLHPASPQPCILHHSLSAPPQH